MPVRYTWFITQLIKTIKLGGWHLNHCWKTTLAYKLTSGVLIDSLLCIMSPLLGLLVYCYGRY